MKRQNVFVLPLFMAAVMLIGGTLFSVAPYTYRGILTFLGLHPFRFPFLDWIYIPASAHCWHDGIDVYQANPCDPLNRPMGYSPLWLRATFFPLAAPWVHVWGLAIDLMFVASLALLPATRAWWATAALIVAGASGFTLFALERANVDIAMFVLCVLAARLSLPTASRNGYLSYVMIMLAGLLKFYPIVALLLAIRESRRVFFCVAALSIVTAAAFFLSLQGEILLALHNVPTGTYLSGETFGARNLPYGFVRFVRFALKLRAEDPSSSGHPLAAFVRPGGPVAVVLLISVIMASAAASVLLVRKFDINGTLKRLCDCEIVFLLMGSALISACFLSGQSVIYRGVFLFLVIPGLTALGVVATQSRQRTLFLATTIVILLLMWAPLAEQAITGGNTSMRPNIAFVGLWVVRETGWWWVVTMLDAILIGIAMSSPAIGGLLLKVVDGHGSPSTGATIPR